MKLCAGINRLRVLSLIGQLSCIKRILHFELGPLTSMLVLKYFVDDMLLLHFYW